MQSFGKGVSSLPVSGQLRGYLSCALGRIGCNLVLRDGPAEQGSNRREVDLGDGSDGDLGQQIILPIGYVFLRDVVRARLAGEADQAFDGENLPAAAVLHRPFHLTLGHILVPKLHQISGFGLFRFIQVFQDVVIC